MSRAHQYHRPNAPNTSEEDPESDIDIDLEELGPQKAANEHYFGSDRGHLTLQRHVQIPLQKLRAGSLRASGRRTRTSDGGTGGQTSQANPDELFQDAFEGEEMSENYINVGDATPLLNDDGSAPSGNSGAKPLGSSRFFNFLSGMTGESLGQGRDQERNDDMKRIGSPRRFSIGQYPPPRFPPNAVSNAKYTPWSFLPRTLYNEFSFFINIYFLLVALSQTIPQLRIGYLSTYIAPLAFVLTITLGKEALDDIARRRRDTEANKEEYTVLKLMDDAKGFGTTRKDHKTLRFQTGGRKRTASTGQNRLDAIEEEEETIETRPNAKDHLEVAEVRIKSRDLKVGDVLKLGKDQRVPADLVILRSYSTEAPAIDSSPSMKTRNFHDQVDLLAQLSTDPLVSNSSAVIRGSKQSLSPDNSTPSADADGVGETFIRTDQLDGETDWKLRLASPLTQSLHPREYARLTMAAEKPDKKVNEFIGSIELASQTRDLRSNTERNEGRSRSKDHKVMTAPLTVDNTAWANTVIASSTTVLAVVVYTGSQTRQAMSTSSSRSKTGLLEYEINNLTKILCALTLTLSVVLVALEGFDNREDQKWYVSITRFLILFSTIIPISLRVNLDMGKTVYAWFIERDYALPGALVRTSTIPEDLGRIEYLLSDKTGTLTQNEMELKKIHVGTVSYANEAMEEVSSYVRQGFSNVASSDPEQPNVLVTPSTIVSTSSVTGAATRTKREIGSRVRDVVLALALCHNVTPTTEVEDGESITTYQASSPDEIAIVRWTESVGLRVVHRDRHGIALQSVDSSRIAVRVRILEVFPFTSEGKRMGIILQFLQGSESSISSDFEGGEIWFYQKGADTVMASIVAANDWLDEETANMAREGLRTLVVGRRRLSSHQYEEFAASYRSASLTFESRDSNMARVVREHLEHNLELLGVTGVEDKLQKDVKPSLELLRNAGIKIWMLTGDKVETARCVAVSSKLVSRSQNIQTITQLPLLTRTDPQAATDALSLLNSDPSSTALLIDGDSLSYLLSHHRLPFISTAIHLPAVIACRCSPTQKADVALLIRHHTKKRIACIGDGGNDVSMIQAADVGIGIVGKEGRQASLAADFSITQFHHLTKLLLWHGRNSYKRSAKLAQFVIHRGLIISVAQTVYSIATYFEPIALYRDWLLVGYATVYTMAPVFSLVLDRDVDEHLANLYPELYKELTSGNSLSYRTFAIWLLVSIYQGIIIQGLSQLLVRQSPTDPSSPPARMISVSFTALVINELVMVAFEITTWCWIMVASLLGTAIVYAASVPFLGEYFDLAYVWSWAFAWRVVAIAAISLVPPYCVKLLRRTLKPPSYRKVRGV